MMELLERGKDGGLIQYEDSVMITLKQYMNEEA